MTFANSIQKHNTASNVAVRGFKFCSLPPEIRNRIMWFALGGGSINLPQVREVMKLPHERMYENRHRHETISLLGRLYTLIFCISDQYNYYSAWTHDFEDFPTVVPDKEASAVGLLIENKKLYQENVSLYWSTNNIVLARGSYKHSELLFATIRPEHIALIKSVIVNLTIADLTPSLVLYLEKSIRDQSAGLLLANDYHQAWGLFTSGLLLDIWLDKLRWVAKTFSPDTTLTINWLGNKLSLDTLELSKALTPVITRESTLAGFRFHRGRAIAEFIIEHWVAVIGWENFKEMLVRKEVGETGDFGLVLRIG